MNRLLKTAMAMVLLSGFASIAPGQDATQTQIEQRDPNFCGAAGAGCDPADVQKWKAVGNTLADLSSADLSQYAYACAKHADWKRDCETNPAVVLRRLGVEGY